MRYLTHQQAATETLDYGWDWSGYWGDVDTIATSSWSVSAFGADAAGTLPTIDAQTNDTTTTTAWIVGGDVDAWVTNRVTSAAGRVAERAFLLRAVAQRQERI